MPPRGRRLTSPARALAGLRTTIGRLEDERSTLLARLGVRQREIDALEVRTVALASRGADAEAATLREQIGALRAARREIEAELVRVDREIAAAVGRHAARLRDPCDAEADVPLVLLPVRLETRFADDRTLRVRIYPDDVHVDQLETGLGGAERAAGTRYWDAIWYGGTAAEAAAWQELLEATGPDRAAWIVRALTPENLAARPEPGAANPPSPDYPPTAPPTLRPAVARGLPDRFVVVAIQGTDVSTETGRPIPPELVIGLPPDNDPAKLTTQAGLTIGVGMEWMFDYAQAEQVGMAITLRLRRPGVAIDRLLVFGVRASLAPDAGAAELERLLAAQRFARGVAFVPQGTPTNNTERNRSGWQRRPVPTPPAPRAVTEDANAGRTARALGIGPGLLTDLPHGDAVEQGLARAANTALWGPSWGTFLDELILIEAGGATFRDDQREALRDLFQDHVRGRGPLPALRLGDQPYGLLPVSSVDRRWAPDRTSPVEPGLLGLLRRARAIWRESLVNVPTVTDGLVDDELLEILGSSPTMLGLRVRSLTSRTMSMDPGIAGLSANNTAMQEQLDRMLWQSLGFDPARIGLRRAIGATTRPLALPLVDESDPAFIAALLDPSDPPREVKSVLQALLELAEDYEQRTVHAASPPRLADTLVERTTERAAELAAPLAGLVRTTLEGRAEAVELHGMADRVEAVVGPAGPSLLAEHQPVAGTRGSLAEVALNPVIEPAVAGDLALGALGAWLRASARLQEFRAALTRLAATELEERRLLVAEALDLASHRLDAWTTALVSRRLDALRRARPGGVLLGAYGWVENLKPGETTTRRGGYIHAPSLAHAASAGILRSGYLTHNPPGGGGGALAIDLSSARVRDAIGLLDGIRQGQPLGALLGYRIERRLHDIAREEPSLQLDRFILSLRALTPLVAGKLSDRKEQVPQAARESIAANNVVDGVRLLEMDRGDIRDALDQKPAYNIYLEGPWKKPTATEWARINAVLDEAARSCDALADLLLAEAVHQLASGNPERAAAALDAAGAGDAPPPEPDVVRTPTHGLTLTHRLLLLLPESGPTLPGWNQAARRAAAEPRLERWAEAQLGPASQIVVQVAAGGARRTLDEADLCALDVVYDAASLDARVRRAIPSLGSGPLAETRDPTWPPGLRTLAEAREVGAALLRLLAGARPALPDAFARPNDLRPNEPPTRRVVQADLAALQQRVEDARTVLNDAVSQLGKHLPDPIKDDQPSAVALAEIRAALGELAGFGIVVPEIGGEAELPRARAAHAEAARRVAAAEAALDAAVKRLAAEHAGAGNPPVFDELAGLAAAAALFGDGFWMLPLVELAGGSDRLVAALGALDPGYARIRRFLRDVASVREGIARHAETLLFADALGVRRPLRIAQLGASGVGWVGLPFDPAALSVEDRVTSIVVDAPTTLGGADRAAGLVLEEWVEVVPRGIESPAAVGGPEPRVTSGVAANVNAPNARPPQAILLAVSPDGARWTRDALADTLTDTLELAKLRAVPLERAVWAGRILPALQAASWSLQGEKTLDILKLATELRVDDAMLDYVKD